MTRSGWLLVLVGLLAVVAYLTSLGNGFTYDDSVIIEENPRVLDATKMGDILTTPYWGSRAGGGLYRPVTTFTYALNHRLGGMNPFGYHLVNVMLHAVVSVLVALLAAAFLPAWAAALAGGLFAVHPIHVEAVANVVGRAELLAAVGFLGAWLAARRARSADGGATWRIAAAFLFGIALFSKEVAVGLPVALLVADWLERRRPDWALQACLAAPLALYLFARWKVLGSVGLPKESVIYRLDNVIATQPFLPGLWTALSVFGRYLVLLIFPWRLSADYSWAQIREATPTEPWAWIGVMGAAALTVLFVRFAMRARRGGETGSLAAAVGLLLFGATFLTVSNFVLRIGTVMAERLLYLPSAGFLLLVAAGAVPLAGRGRVGRTVVTALALLALVAGTVRSLDRSRDWKNNATLHATTLKTSPRSARARFNQAPILWEAGRPVDAIQAVRDAIAIDSTYTEAWTNLGGYLVKEERYDEAREALRGALASTPGDEYATLALGALELEVGNAKEAITWFERIVRANPGRSEAWYDLGLARQAIADTVGAIQAFRGAVHAQPKKPDADAQNNLAWLLILTAKTPAERAAAVEEARLGTVLRPDAATWDTLAEGLLRNGDRTGAIAAWRKAIELGAANPDSIRAKLGELEHAGEAPGQRGTGSN